MPPSPRLGGGESGGGGSGGGSGAGSSSAEMVKLTVPAASLTVAVPSLTFAQPDARAGVLPPASQRPSAARAVVMRRRLMEQRLLRLQKAVGDHFTLCR